MRDTDEALTQHGWLPEFLTDAALEHVQTDYEVLQLLRRSWSWRLLRIDVSPVCPSLSP